MKYKDIGTTGISASRVAFGAWAIGGWMWGGADEKEAIKAIHAAIDAGMNFIDTAPVYGFGRSEEIVGKAIKDRRDKVVLASKCGLIWHEERGVFFFASDEKQPTTDGARKIYRCLAPDVIRYEIEQSLRRLQTDHIDLYQTHWQDSTSPIQWSVQTMMELQDEGKIRAIGCCNADVEQMDMYRDTGKLDSDQELFSLLDRKHLGKNLPYARAKNLAFLAYSPLAQGLLTGKLGPEREFSEGDQRGVAPRFSVGNRQRVRDFLDRLQPIAERHRATLAQLAIGWALAQPGCTHALVGARSTEQVLENAAAAELRLSTKDLAEINQILAEGGKDIR
ncbi:MAG TPA: aldo/keto reductase [Desulfofustis sp.]|jgi:methylglyoxal reductase|nr:aldo/keto reductase [Desulfofustis sp. PB-SRB1]HBH27950.1 aldo/keto reductase [Desulfofustis sp.]